MQIQTFVRGSGAHTRHMSSSIHIVISIVPVNKTFRERLSLHGPCILQGVVRRGEGSEIAHLTGSVKVKKLYLRAESLGI